MAHDDNFVQEYLYIEEYPIDIEKHRAKQDNDDNESQRGALIISLFEDQDD